MHVSVIAFTKKEQFGLDRIALEIPSDAELVAWSENEENVELT